MLLPFEDHGYQARENVEHVLWEQLRWFDTYVKGAGNATQGALRQALDRRDGLPVVNDLS